MKRKKLFLLFASFCLILVLAASPFMAACAKPAVEPGAVDVAALQKEIATLEKEVAAGEKEIASLEKEVAAGEKEVASLETKITTAEKKASTSEKEAAASKKEVAALEKKITTAEKEIATLEGKVATAEKEIAKLEAAVPAPEPVPEPLPTSIAPVLVLEGNEYEMGYQYGYQGAERIGYYKDALWATFTGEGGYLGYTQAGVEETLKGFQYYILEYAPELIDFLKGMADGSTDAGYPLTYIDALLLQHEWEMWEVFGTDVPEGVNYPSPVEDLPPKEKGCSTFAAWGDETTEGQLVSIFSVDAEYRDMASIIYIPDTGNSFIATQCDFGYMTYSWIQNDEGLCIGITYGESERPEDNQYGLGIVFLTFRMARWCDSATEAKDMLLGTQTTTGWNYLIADPSGDAYVVETTGAHKAVRESGDFGENGNFLVLTNYYLTDEMQVSQRPPYYREGRYDRLFDALTDYAGSVDLEFAKLMERTPPVCHEENKMENIGVVKVGEVPKTYVCTGSANWVNGGSSKAPIEPTFSFYELALEETAVEIALTAKWTALSYMGDAHSELYGLVYADAEFAPLRDLLSKASAEYYRGVMALDDGKLAATAGDRDEAVYKYSEAITAFTRCQAISLQVYNTIVPFPTSPADLGL